MKLPPNGFGDENTLYNFGQNYRLLHFSNTYYTTSFDGDKYVVHEFHYEHLHKHNVLIPVKTSEMFSSKDWDDVQNWFKQYPLIEDDLRHYKVCP